MSTAVSVKNNVVLVNFRVFYENDLANIIDRMKMIYETCGFKFSFCGFYSRDCNGYFALYVKPCYDIKSINDLYKYPMAIVSVAKILVFPSIIEIYDVCTLKEHRNNGHVKTMLTTIEHAFYNKNMWIAIRFTHSDFDKIVNLYVEQGFGNPKVVRKTSQNHQLVHPVLELRYPSIDDKEEVKQKARVMKQKLMMEVSAGFHNNFMVFY